MNDFARLLEIVARLRAEDGCPWDRAQTEATLGPYLLEEAYETLDALDRRDDPALAGEIGDLLFTAAMICQIASERGAFRIGDALDRVSDKMVRRHPHVFAGAPRAGTAGIEAWEARKTGERGPGSSSLDGVPLALPALLRAHRISEKASRVGFDWKSAEGVREKLDEELGELDRAVATGDEDRIREELGDVLFTLVNLGRHLPVGTEEALRAATARFEARFRRLERKLTEEGLSVHEMDAEALEGRWRAAKDERP